MSGEQSPKSWFDRAIGGCVSILMATISLYCAAQVLQAILPALIVAVGIGALVWAVWAFIQYRRNRY